MENEPKEPENLEGNDGDAAQGAAGTEPKEPEAGEKVTEQNDEGLKDKHGQPGINRDKYQRDMKAKDDEIAELRAQVDELTKTEEGRAEAQKRIDELEQTIKDDRLNFELEKAGCRNLKAGKALLDDYEGSVDKLKEAEPWLFEDEKKGSTGLKPGGTDALKNARLEKARKAAAGEIYG